MTPFLTGGTVTQVDSGPARSAALSLAASGLQDASQVERSDDLMTIIAIAIVVYALADVAHEGLGHGGACLLVGGKALVLSTVHFDCSVDARLIDAGGTIVNLALGVACWLWSRRTYVPRLRYFLWLLMTVNLLQAGGYFLYSGIANIGDWAGVIAGLQPAWLWRLCLTVVGVATYMAFVWLALAELRPFLDRSADTRVRQGRRLCLVPYVAGGILSCVAGLFNPVGMILVAISAAAASLGGTSGLAWMWQLLRSPHRPIHARKVLPIDRSTTWVTAGAVLAVLFIALLGRGISFQGH